MTQINNLDPDVLDYRRQIKAEMHIPDVSAIVANSCLVEAGTPALLACKVAFISA